VEGLVPMRTLDDDEYLFHERLHSLVGRTTKRRIRLGDRVRVRLDAVDVERRTIDFSLVAKEKGEAPGPPSGTPHRRTAGGKGKPPKAKKRRSQRRGGGRRGR